MEVSSPHGFHRHSTQLGFTLIELLVVIAIIAILAVVVVLVLNPAELLRQSRDANRLSDLATMNSAINLYISDQTGSSGFSLGSPSVSYVSILDPTASSTAGSNCAGLGVPFTLGGNFGCAASSTYRKVNSTGWIPINFSAMSSGAPFGSIPVDPLNQTSSLSYYTYVTNGTTFKLIATPESQKYQTQTETNSNEFIAGSNLSLAGGPLGQYWVLVPGSIAFSAPNFWVMKYDASCLNATSGVALTSPLDNNGYNNNNSAASNCVPSNGIAAAPLPGAIPLVDITQASSSAACTAIGTSLITNTQWQTIAWNAEGVATNWSGGAVGSGYMYSGHGDGTPSQQLVASSSDSASCYGTDGPASCGGTGSNATQIRTDTLSNGSVVWDIGGNIYDWTSDQIAGKNEPNAGVGAFATLQYSVITTWGSMTQQTVGPMNSAWNSAQGIGEIYSEGNSGDNTTYAFQRGGGWGSYPADGVEGLDVNNIPAAVYSYIGVRCVH